jgi:hypothetical protein
MNSLNEVADALRKNGMQVVDVADTGSPIAAIVYSAKVGPKQPTDECWEKPHRGSGVDDLVLMLYADCLSVEAIVARAQEVRREFGLAALGQPAFPAAAPGRPGLGSRICN